MAVFFVTAKFEGFAAIATIDHRDGSGHYGLGRSPHTVCSTGGSAEDSSASTSILLTRSRRGSRAVYNERIVPSEGKIMFRRLAVVFPLISCSCFALGEVSEHRNPETGLSSWKAEHKGFSLELIQILPDYVRASYAARGLPAELIERVTRYCVFGTIVRNESDAPLSWRLADWRYVTGDRQEHTLKPKSEWVREWREFGVPFRWTLLPDEQTYEVGDWGQGFTTLALRPGESFDLLYSWTQNGQTYHGQIEHARCAPETASTR